MQVPPNPLYSPRTPGIQGCSVLTRDWTGDARPGHTGIRYLMLYQWCYLLSGSTVCYIR